MPNTREKMIELAEVIDSYFGCDAAYFDVDKFTLAKRIMEAGWTKQEWISVKDRLPEQTDPATAVLGITERGRCHIVHYFKGVTSEEFTGFYDICSKREITYWMPLPQPPKGE